MALCASALANPCAHSLLPTAPLVPIKSDRPVLCRKVLGCLWVPPMGLLPVGWLPVGCLPVGAACGCWGRLGAWSETGLKVLGSVRAQDPPHLVSVEVGKRALAGPRLCVGGVQLPQVESY